MAQAPLENAPKPPSRVAAPALAMLALAVTAALAWADRRFNWVAGVFKFIAHQFFEVPMLAAIRAPSQIVLVRVHLLVLAIAVISYLGVRPLLRPAIRKLFWIMAAAYLLRAVVWICGGNLPLVPGDSCHYVEIASSILNGEGPVKHYVESYFIDYPEIREGKGILDDWATPLYSYVLAGLYRVLGIAPGGNLEATFAVAKGASFGFGLATIPLVFILTYRRLGLAAAHFAAGLLAILPVHVLYSAIELRESLVAFLIAATLLFLCEMHFLKGVTGWLAALLSGICAGLAIMTRNTSMALAAAFLIHSLWRFGRKDLGKILLWAACAAAVCSPWAYVTYMRYGKPFYTYTQFFQYTFSWTVHHYQEGVPTAASFYTWANAPTILRVKIKSLFIIVIYSSMIASIPVVMGLLRRTVNRGAARRESGRFLDELAGVSAFVFITATIANIADVTQVAQLGRYYLPLFVIVLPAASAGLIDWFSEFAPLDLLKRSKLARGLCAALFALLWSDPTWAYDYTWLVKPYQLHWPAIRETGDWIKSHPEAVPGDSRILTWFPWELRIASGRTTVLLPRSFYPSVSLQSDRLERAVKEYNVTHVLWGSFETPPHEDPESLGRYLDMVRKTVLAGSTNLFDSSLRRPYAVRLYRLPRSARSN